jgi:PAS domain S-box-containing protein
MRLRHKNGNWRLLEAVGSNLVNNNVVEAVIVNYRDITERKQKEDALQKSEERLRLVAERTNDLIYERDLVTGIATFYGEMDALHGYEPGGFPCSLEGFIEHLHPDDVIKAGEALLLACEQNRPYEVIHRLRRKDGSYITWWDRAKLVKDERGFPLKLIGAATDITKLKEAQEERDQAEIALKASESKYRLLADNISDVIFVLDMNLNFTYVSPSVKILRGYEQEEVMKQSALEMLTPSSADLATRTMSEIMELEKSGQREMNDTYRTLQLEMKRKDGTTMWTEVKMSFIRDDHQQPIAIVGLTRDITERQRYETELKNFAENLEDTNIALRVLMNKRNEDQKDFEEKLQVNINDLVIPYLTRLNKKDLDDRSKNYLSVLESNLSNILSPFMRDFRSSQKNLTPQEIQIVDLIMKGKNTKEIADMLNASVNTVATHRNNIRKKLNLRKSKINLRSYLLSLQ